jgi:prepilin-type N-terminal cleavage/methylation domain-containing protein
MKIHRLQIGLTLVEILVAVAIVAVLAGIVLTTLTRIDSQSKEHLCQGTLETLNTALRQYRDYRRQLNVADTLLPTEIDFYRSLTFPPDCNDYSVTDIETEITNLMDLSPPAVISPPGKHDPNESGITVMYFFLSQVPECRETLGNIDQSMLKSDHNDDKVYLRITIDAVNNRSYPWLRVVDPWGKPLRYDYYANQKEEDPVHNWVQRKKTIRSFPLITSAGPDGLFNTNDDITNREKTEEATYQP